MTTNLKITIDDKADITLEPVTGSATDSTLTIELEKGPVEAWDNGAAGNGEFDLIGNGFPINDNHHKNVDSREINRIEITGPTDILTTLRNLIFLKDDVKNIGKTPQNIFDFELTIDKDLKKQGDHWNITAPTGAGTNDRILKLTVADFGGKLDESKISIDDTEYHTDPNNKIKVVEDRRGQKWALLNLEKLLKKAKDKYGNVLKALDYANREKGPDYEIAEIFSKIPELGKDPSWKNLEPTFGLWSYFSGVISGFPKIPFKDQNIRHILGKLKDDRNLEVYEIRGLIDKLVTLRNISLNFGKIKLSQMFILESYEIDGEEVFKLNDEVEKIIRELRKEPGFYKGFSMIDPNLQAFTRSGRR